MLHSLNRFSYSDFWRFSEVILRNFEIFLLELLWLTAGGTMANCGAYDGLPWRAIVWELLSLIVGVNLLIREAAIVFY